MRLRSAARLALLLGGLFLLPSVGWAEDDPSSAPAVKQAEINGADTAWMMTASALVLMMTAPGLAFFYSGLVRRKNVLGEPE